MILKVIFMKPQKSHLRFEGSFLVWEYDSNVIKLFKGKKYLLNLSLRV